ncbi:MAG: hypothetical protein A2Y86_08345 [Candidatus Aminicenantes bacterium RBG_13_62_12]|nr:MAG: hypothetical protein A2Y86_08345 [Candidatus Aminicenantes bacterium RBG_13_62_12]
MALRFIATAACLGCLALPARAQEAREIEPSIIKRDAYREVVGPEIRDPSLTSPIAAPAVDFQLTTENKYKKAKALVGLRVGNDLFFDVKFIAPLSDGDSEVEPIDMDGLSKSSVVDMGIHFLAWNPRLDAEIAREVFEEYLRRHPSSSSAAGARPKPISLLMLRDEPDLRKRFLEAVEWGNAYFAAFRLKVGRQGFTYADADFREISTQKTSRAVEAAGGVLTPRFGYFGVNLEYQVFFDGAASTELILPFRQGSAEQVKKLVFGPPSRGERFKIQFEHRKAVTEHLALNPKLSYFPREKVTLAELPVYLFKNADEGLNGGVTLSWTSKHGGRFGMGIFIGASFSIFP